ncbi:hypothetical protein ACLMAJ_17330 [Nocardia sp. KC 131]|uniref:hypothetical protein n=1 Tax=Nocardia arseniciresistens TaxID=3392119 RepID=UPI00398F5339
MFIPLVFAGSLVLAHSATAAPRETYEPVALLPSEIHASLPPRPAPNGWEGVLAVGTGSVGALVRSVPASDGAGLPSVTGSSAPGLPSTGSAGAGLLSVPDIGSLPGLLRLNPSFSGAVSGSGAGSAGDVPRIVGDLLRLLELVRQVPLPLPAH